VVGQGALSDADVAKAAGELVPVRIHIYQDPKNVAGKFNVLKVPKFMFLAPEGKVLETYEGELQAGPMAARFRDIAGKSKRDLPWEESYEKALEKARQGTLVAALFQAEDTGLAAALLDDSLQEVVKRLAFVKFSSAKNSADAKKFKVERGPALLLLDADGKEVARAEGKKSSKDLKAFLEKSLQAGKAR